MMLLAVLKSGVARLCIGTKFQSFIARAFLAFLLLPHISLWAEPPTSPAKLIAAQITAENQQALQLQGPDAIAGIGDWFLSNGTICVLISDKEHENGLSPWGGNLIDLGHCKRGNDQFAFNHFMPNMDKELILRPVSISADIIGDTAEIRVTSEGFGLSAVSRYQLNTKTPEQLDIFHELHCMEDCIDISMLGILTLHPHRALTPYTLSSRLSDYSAGFNHLGFNRFDSRSQLAAMLPNDISVLVGADGLDADITYGVQLHDAWLIRPGEPKQSLPIFSITDPGYTLQGILARQPWLGGGGKLGVLEMVQSQFMRLQEGESLQLGQRISLAARTDVAAITNSLYRAEGRELQGKVIGGPARVSISSAYGEPITETRLDASGKFSVLVPQRIELALVDVITPWGKRPVVGVTMDAPSVDMGVVQLEQGTYIALNAETPCRVTVLGLDVEDPEFFSPLMGFTVDDEPFHSPQVVNYLSLAGDKLASGRLPIKPGRYRILASRGLEYGVTVQDIEVKAGQYRVVQVQAPQRELSTSGYMAADFHVHSGLSFDSSLAVPERLRSFAAQGGEVLVATEHNRLVDISEAVHRHQLADELVVMPGVELTGMVRSPEVPFTHGHQNIFPMVSRAGEFSGGLLKHEGRRIRTLIGDVRKRDEGALFQLNHPRNFDAPDPDLAYFENLLSGQPYDPDQALAAERNRSLVEKDPLTGLRDIDVDLIEVANGNNFRMYEAVRRDWFSLLSQGERVFGTANSDSHGSNSLVALPVNYVAQASDAVADYSQQHFVSSVGEGNFFGTTGPILDLQVGGMGQTVDGFGGLVSGGEITIKLTIRAASWVPVDELKLFINGQLVISQPIRKFETIEMPMQLDRDSYIVIQVEGEPDGLYEDLAPGFRPFAFSNPVFIDADNDGSWQPPGLSAAL